MSSERNITLDIAKGIAICLIVLGHIRNAGTQTVLYEVISFVNYFHVAAFFIISGYFSSPFRGWKEYIIKKGKRLVLPYYISNAILIILDIIMIWIVSHCFSFPSFAESLRAFVGIEPFRMAGPTWFLMTLFYVSLVYKVLVDICRNDVRLALLVSILISILCYFVQNNTDMTGAVFLTRTSLSLGFFSIGHFCHEKGGSLIQRIKTKEAFLYLIGSVSFLAVLYFVLNYRVSYYWMKGYNILFSYLSGIAGTVLIISISKIIEKSSVCIKRVLGYYGRNSMPVLLYHYLVFRIVNILLCHNDMMPALDSICYDPCQGRWIIYLMLGIIVPIIPGLFKKYVKEIK